MDMQNENYAATFSVMLDSELLKLATQTAALNDSAQEALGHELLRRGIVNGVNEPEGNKPFESTPQNLTKKPKIWWLWPMRVAIIVAITAVGFAVIPPTDNDKATEALGSLFLYFVLTQLGFSAAFRLRAIGTAVLSAIATTGFVLYMFSLRM